MIFIPWAIFICGCAWMVWKGTKAKQEYRRHKEEEKERAKAIQAYASRQPLIVYSDMASAISGGGLIPAPKQGPQTH